MAEAAVSSLIQLLGNLLIEKVKFLGAVEGEVKRLKKKLEWMEGFLQHAEEKKATDVRVQKWISDIREVAFDAEDVIQIFILNVEIPRKSRGLVGRCICFPSHLTHLDRVAEEIESIWKRLDDIGKSCDDFGIKDLGPRVDWTQQPNHAEWHRRLIPTQKDTNVVGLEKDVQSLLESAILDDKSSLSAATVVGMGGIGKSTLARIVYNHDDVVKQFELRAWVVVSNEFEPRQIFKDFLLELFEPHQDRSKRLEEIQHEKAPEILDPRKYRSEVQDEMSNQKSERSKLLETIQHEDASKLRRRLYDRLNGKRYLIVLDDVWEDDHWTCFANAFPNNDKGSRLLITSRNQLSLKGVAQYTHFMKTLDPDKSWSLLLNKALPTDNTEVKLPKDLEKLGREMVEKCGGLPLAINAVGGLLLKEGQSRIGWMKVSQQINSHLGKDNVFGILELSYRALPPRLKPCFLCMSFFKEDAIIRAVKLKNIWISLGYIQQEGEERVETVATRYLEELVSRNLIQVKNTSSDGRQIKICQVHDLIRALSITKAKEEMGLEMLGGKVSSSQPLDKPHHRALYRSLADGESSRNKRLRSLFVCVDVTSAPSSYWKDFELLKLLDLEDCVSLTELPEAIGALIGLTYLGLKNTKVRKLPESLRKLKNLEVIELRDGLYLPRSALELINLRHIDADVFLDFFEVSGKISPLKHIHRLKQMAVGGLYFEQQLENITEMTNLSYFAMFMFADSNSNSITLFNSLKKLKNLERLTLYAVQPFQLMEGLSTLGHVTRLKLNGRMTGFPTEFPPNVSHLTLKNNRLKEDPMPVLEKLPCLSYLHLHEEYGLDECQEMAISNEGFPKLEILKFTNISRLLSVRVREGAMPELKRVEIRGCSNLNKESLKEQLRSSIVVDIFKNPWES